jgi:hypothetical protein
MDSDPGIKGASFDLKWAWERAKEAPMDSDPGIKGASFDPKWTRERSEEAHTENNEGFSTYSNRRPSGGNPQLVIITQLLQIVTNMQHIDELFLWLSHTIGERLDVPVIQLWANQAHTTGAYSTELRVAASQNSSLPLHVVNNVPVTEVVKSLLNERHGVRSQPVGSVFLLPQADLLARYNLHYWESTFFSNNTLLPPMSNDISSGAIPTPLAMIASLFTHQPSNVNRLATVTRIFEHALSIARNRGLLLDAANSPLSPSASSMNHRGAQPQQLTLGALIPHRAQSADTIQASNPLASAVVISDKQARRLYSYIDGKRNIANVLDLTQTDQEEFTAALRWLLRKKLIRLYEPKGKLVDSSFLEPL